MQHTGASGSHHEHDALVNIHIGESLQCFDIRQRDQPPHGQRNQSGDGEIRKRAHGVESGAEGENLMRGGLAKGLGEAAQEPLNAKRNPFTGKTHQYQEQSAKSSENQTAEALDDTRQEWELQ